MTTLITGAAGFIGYHAAKALLTRGERVIGIDSLNDYYDPRLKHARLSDLRATPTGTFHFHQLDFADEDQLRDALASHEPTRVLHLGAQPGVRYSLENPGAYARSNLIGHLNILELCRHRRLPLVYASSSSVYGGNESLPFRVEDRADHPVSLYAATKRADELMSESYAHLYRLPQTGLRFFTVYGPWGRPDMAVWGFTQKIMTGEPIRLFNHGRMRRDFTYIDDIIAGVLACLDRPPADDGHPKPGGSRSSHAIYNIGNSRSEELRDLVSAIEAACGRKAIIELAEMQPGDVHATFAEISAIERDMGFAPRTSISEGIPRFVDWYRGYLSRRG